jgi:DNA-binding NarL/FixJ family response regulator
MQLARQPDLGPGRQRPRWPCRSADADPAPGERPRAAQRDDPGSVEVAIAEFVSRAPTTRTPHPLLHLLTQREREVVALVAEGLSNEEIAGTLVVSPATARTHVSRAMTKLGARDRAQLVVFAYQSGLA